jgi:hypothetical protein
MTVCHSVTLRLIGQPMAVMFRPSISCPITTSPICDNASKPWFVHLTCSPAPFLCLNFLWETDRSHLKETVNEIFYLNFFHYACLCTSWDQDKWSKTFLLNCLFLVANIYQQCMPSSAKKQRSPREKTIWLIDYSTIVTFCSTPTQLSENTSRYSPVDVRHNGHILLKSKRGCRVTFHF